MNFISDRCKKMHAEYLRGLKLKMRVFEKSYPDMEGADVNGILRSRASRAERDSAARLKAEIMAHEIYFSSYGASFERCELLHSRFGSEAAFLHALRNECTEADGGFLLIFRRSREISWYVGTEIVPVFLKSEPILALDLAEHAYFEDYGFDRDRYIGSALSRLNLSKIKNHIEKTII